MPIMAQTSEDDLARAQTRTFLWYVLNILNDTHDDRQHAEVLMGRLFDTTQMAAQKEEGLPATYRKQYTDALGEDVGLKFLDAFNTCIEKYKQDLHNKVEKPRFEFRSEEEKKEVVAAIKKLHESTTQYRGFFIPYPTMGYPPRDHSRCTGR